jgi:hypothetical protein
MDPGNEGGKMKKAFVVLLVAIGVALAVTLPAGADPVGGEDPDCGDIIGGGAFYNDTVDPENTVGGSISLNSLSGELSCKDVSYTMYVTYTSNARQKTKSQTIHGDGVNDVLFFSIANVSADGGPVCVYYETAKGNNVIDRAPDEGCISVPPDDSSSPGGSDFT